MLNQHEKKVIISFNEYLIVKNEKKNFLLVFFYLLLYVGEIRKKKKNVGITLNKKIYTPPGGRSRGGLSKQPFSLSLSLFLYYVQI